METAKYQISLKAILKNDENNVLILKTSESHIFWWKYDFPWGRINIDEIENTYIDILRREIFEETWIMNVNFKNQVVAIWSYKNNIKNELTFCIAFEWRISNSDINLSLEHLWFTFVDLNKINLEEYFCSWMLEIAKMYLDNKK